MFKRSITNGFFLLLAGCLGLTLAGCHSSGNNIVNAPGTTGIKLTYAVVDTDQTSCYESATGVETACTGTGYDADYAGTQPSYTVSTDGRTVKDNVTGLTWLQSSDTNGDGVVNYADKMYQPDAEAYCRDLVLNGQNDWRLPTIKEAHSLILFTGKDASSYTGTDTSTLTPFISSVFDWAFGDLSSGIDRIIDGQYATSTLYVSTTMNGNATMFGVNFVDGRIKGYPLLTKKFYVRCVRGNTEYGINQFVDNGDQTISDTATGLMWQQNDSDSTNWDDAVAQCESASTAGYADWRLPNAKELQSIVDYTRSPDTTGSAAISPFFNASPIVNEAGQTDWGYYWASTTHLTYDGEGSNAAYVAFGRALGYMNGTIMDVHGAGAQRSNDKLDVATEPGAQSVTNAYGTFYYKGPQGDILRNNNKVRCVRDIANNSTSPYYTLFAPMQSRTTYLIDSNGNPVHSWKADTRPALSVYLLPDGELLRTGKVGTLPATFSSNVGGSGGVIEILDWDGNIVWSKTLATDTCLSNHDVAVLPNGNILAIVWEAKSAAEVLALGRTSVSDATVWAGAVYEICRYSATNTCTDGDIVWRWSSWDHVAQDVDSGIPGTYVANISDHPDRIDLNYVPGKSTTGFADWMHFNGIDYNAAKDQILISVHNFNEYWIIDHGDSTKGILARVGNPAAYDGTGPQVLFGQHAAHWIPAGLTGAGNILVFNNGLNRPEGAYSSVDEFCGDTGNNCTPGELVSSYSQGPSGTFYADHLGSAQRLKNGDTMVCEGTDGRLFEYNGKDEIVWEYDYGSEIFRAINYAPDYPGLANLK